MIDLNLIMLFLGGKNMPQKDTRTYKEMADLELNLKYGLKTRI